MDLEKLNALVEEGTFKFALGENEEAEAILRQATSGSPSYGPAWHALAEVLFHADRYEEAKEAGEKALAGLEEDVHLHTTLSRIYMELGDKETAEKHGARARVLGWKEQLREEPEA